MLVFVVCDYLFVNLLFLYLLFAFVICISCLYLLFVSVVSIFLVCICFFFVLVVCIFLYLLFVFVFIFVVCICSKFLILNSRPFPCLEYLLFILLLFVLLLFVLLLFVSVVRIFVVCMCVELRCRQSESVDYVGAIHAFTLSLDTHMIDSPAQTLLSTQKPLLLIFTLFVFSPLCLFKCLLKLTAWDDA